MNKVTLYFKSGATITVQCENWEFEKSSVTGKFTRSFLKNVQPTISFDLNELIAYTVEEDEPE